MGGWLFFLWALCGDVPFGFFGTQSMKRLLSILVM